MTVMAAAEYLGIKFTGVYRYLDRGRLDLAPVQGNVKLVTAESVERLKAEREAKTSG